MSSPRTLIIGYGSPIRGDDAVGPLVADRLLDELESDDVQVFSRHILTAELVEHVREASLVIFLDASMDGTAGEVLCRRIEPSSEAISTMAHFVEPGELLGWARELYDRTPDAYLISICGRSFEFAQYELSPPVAAGIQAMIDHVHRLIDEHDVTEPQRQTQ
jgi:hydrogenase maturation protease